MYILRVGMTDEEKKLLSTFEARVRHLIYLHQELKKENAELKQIISSKEEELLKVQQDYQSLQVNYSTMKTVKVIEAKTGDVRDTKLRLSKLVREVDKCIALLNE